MKAQLEDLARTALAITPPAATSKPHTAAHAGAKGTHQAVTHQPAAHAPLPPSDQPATPTSLQNEQFRVFELAYGAGATMVLTADTGGRLAQQKFVTLIAQPDLYGNVKVLLQNVTDGTHLDETPHMRLIDAVDVLADNRGELLFELRGNTQRTFAFYRVLRGRAEKLFAAGGGEYGSLAEQP